MFYSIMTDTRMDGRTDRNGKPSGANYQLSIKNDYIKQYRVSHVSLTIMSIKVQ